MSGVWIAVGGLAILLIVGIVVGVILYNKSGSTTDTDVTTTTNTENSSGGTVVSNTGGTVVSNTGNSSSSAGTVVSTDTSSLTFMVVSDIDQDVYESLATLSAPWGPAYLVTAGDLDYTDPDTKGPAGHAGFKAGIGKHFAGLLAAKRIFPAIGNHDYDMASGDDAAAFIEYFNLKPGTALPGNVIVPSYEGAPYYTFIMGNIQWFVLATTSDLGGGGFSKGSSQYTWLSIALTASMANTAVKFRFLVNHWSPFSTFRYCCAGSCEADLFVFPLAEKGIDAIFTGHDHGMGRYSYPDESVEYQVGGKSYGKLAGWGGMMAFMTGSGKNDGDRAEDSCEGSVTAASGFTVHAHHDVLPNSQGALKCTAGAASVKFEYYNTKGTLVDTCTLTRGRGRVGTRGRESGFWR
ncbi:hypothetical protein SARC_00097 [Sphaeroforma arctica JP610]|uniref:Calcineurin-like phosphoesterase domain-containing protein n=1 Tax=Sphaeroforma arctica JP610 TaxID=667725 RepID=A0A0L0GFI5_9EUKA|nr:hypothetical protein SARC_00097 [Sphaeroforma arctica JP610]KNC87840.1 hypothetical protein SARC_00097 [Sphaeroforma arctica JP610]|eukprot:XP_014161742.1 hypothetical protein SARC_00097 [Sphaeroforma arctica JP610]